MSDTDLIIPAEDRQLVSSAQQQANALKVTSPEQAEQGSVLLTSIKEYKKALTTRKEEMTRPLMRSLASIRDLFRPHELDLSDAERTVKAKLGAWQIEEDARAARETAKVLEKVESGRMRADTASGKLAEIGPTKKIKGIKMMTRVKVRIMDETMIPREYLMPNMALITDAILHKNESIAGVEKYEEKVVASV